MDKNLAKLKAYLNKNLDAIDAIESAVKQSYYFD